MPLQNPDIKIFRIYLEHLIPWQSQNVTPKEAVEQSKRNIK